MKLGLKSNTKMIILFGFSLILSFYNLTSQENRKNPERNKLPKNEIETETTDTTKIIIDTLGLYKPIKNFGTILTSTYEKSNYISKKDLSYDTYYTASDILKNRHIGFPVSLGFYGMNNSAMILGELPLGLDVKYNGISQNEVELNSTNLSLLPIEAFEGMELYLGSDAVILSNNSTGAMLNFNEVINNTAVPYTKLWYSQGSSEMIAADGTFSQNFAKNFNLHLGFRSFNSPGRFSNQWINSWNLRAKVRWNLDSLTNISFSEFFNNYGIGENGGANKNTTSNIFDEVEFNPLLNYTNSRLFKHNLQFSFEKLLDTNRNVVISSKLAFINTDKYIFDGDNVFSNPTDSLTNISYTTRNLLYNAILETNYSFLHLVLGTDLAYKSISDNILTGKESNFSASFYGLGKISILNYVDLSGGLRYINNFSRNAIAAGGKVTVNFGSNQTKNAIYLDISKSDRFPSLMQGLTLENEHHYLAIAGFERKTETTNTEILGFFRQVDLPIEFNYSLDSNQKAGNFTFSNGSNKRIYGLELNHSFLPFKNIYFEGFAKFYYTTFNNKENSFLPNFYGGFKTYYNLKQGRSEMHLGAEYAAIMGFAGYSYFPIVDNYALLAEKSSFMNNGINLFAEARLGSTYVRAKLINLLGSGYYYTPYYPELGFHFQFSVSWAFLD
jgi:hypothetical protein